MIFGNRIRLRAPERSDIPQFVDWLNDPEVLAGIDIFLPLSRVDEEGWFDQMTQKPPSQHPLVIEVKTGDAWKSIGNTGFDIIDWRTRQAEIGIVIGEKAFWNNGYGTEVMRLMVDHGFRTLNLNRIYLRVYETNPRAVRCYEKVGFKQEGRLRQAIYREGMYRDVFIMGILRDEFVSEPH
jgi:RimJ/RimL family protein N-acetyltransferase